MNTAFHCILPLACFSGLAAHAGGPKQNTSKPNVILIYADDLGYGDLECYGAKNIETPHVNRLASEGIRFTNAHATAATSTPSRYSLLTGEYAWRKPGTDIAAGNAGMIIRPEQYTMADIFKSSGYATGAFGKWHLGDARKFLPLQHGFDEYYGLPYSNDMWPNHPQYKFPDLPLIEGNEVIGYNTEQSELTTNYTNRAVDFIRRSTGSGKPFFLYLAHSMPHVPLAVSDKFKGKSEQGLYGDVMMELDWSVGKVMQALREAKVEENTLVILTSDNGPWANYGNHAGSSGGLREAKATTFNGGMRVPCLFYWKGTIAPGSICNDLMSNIDILPTLVELTGAPHPQLPIDGLSMAAILKGTNKAPIRQSLCMYYHRNSLQAITDGYYKLVFPHKYVSYETQMPGNDGQPGELGKKEITECELYDLRRDPGERVNVISQHPAIAEKLQRIADQCREDLGDDLTGQPGKNRREPGRID